MMNYIEYLEGGNVVKLKDREGGFRLPNDMTLLNNIRLKINEWKQQFNEYKRLQEIIPKNDKNDSNMSRANTIDSVRLRLNGYVYPGIHANTMRSYLMSDSNI